MTSTKPDRRVGQGRGRRGESGEPEERTHVEVGGWGRSEAGLSALRDAGGSQSLDPSHFVAVLALHFPLSALRPLVIARLVEDR